MQNQQVLMLKIEQESTNEGVQAKYSLWLHQTFEQILKSRSHQHEPEATERLSNRNSTDCPVGDFISCK